VDYEPGVHSPSSPSYDLFKEVVLRASREAEGTSEASSVIEVYVPQPLPPEEIRLERYRRRRVDLGRISPASSGSPQPGPSGYQPPEAPHHLVRREGHPEIPASEEDLEVEPPGQWVEGKFVWHRKP
jgi:hypothetical protein